MLSYRAAIPLPNRTLTRPAEMLRARRAERRCRWRRLDAGRQALLVLAHLRNGDTYTRPAAGFAVGTTTAWRYVHEAVELLAAHARELKTAIATACRLPYVIVDGTLIPIDRLADDKPYFSGKHHRHGVNVQVLADPAGRLLWISPALPGAAHDLAAARSSGLIDALTGAGILTYADKGYQGAGGTIRTPFKRHRHRPYLSRNQKTVNRAHARIRAVGERAVATLKAWKVPAKLRCCPRRATALVRAIFVLQTIEEDRYSG